MKINTDFQQYHIKKRFHSAKPHYINKYGSHNHIISNLTNNIKKLEINENLKTYKPKYKSFDNSFFIPEQIMKTLLTAMNRDTHLSLNSLNLVNFIYQSYNKGINIVKNQKNNRNKINNIQNCVNQRKFITNYNPNFSMYSTILGEGKNNNIYENIKFIHNDNILNCNESFNNKENCSNLILPNNNFFKKNITKKNINIDSNYNHIINKKKLKSKTKYKIISNTNNINNRFVFKRSNSCKNQNQNDDKKVNEYKKIRYKLFINKYNTSNNYLNFALLPIKNIISNFKKIEKIPPLINNRNLRFSADRKIKNINENDNPLSLKMFTDKYEKEKENFNNILFDECIELRKKKFKLESFIKKFTNKHFVEKLYKAKEYSLKKC